MCNGNCDQGRRCDCATEESFLADAMLAARDTGEITEVYNAMLQAAQEAK